MGAIAAPAVSRATVLRRDEHVAFFHGLLPADRVIHEQQGRRVYAIDAFRSYHAMPALVVLPTTVREVSQVLRYCYETGLKVFPRGGGTSLTGGAVGAEDGIVLCLSQMKRVLAVDAVSRSIRVEAGITNANVSKAVAAKGLHFAPDPASRLAATIGGNIATNAGGARASRYGATAQSLLAVKLVLVDGEVVELGGGELEASAINLAGLVTGSEGMLGVIVEATLRVVPVPVARRLVLLGFQSVAAAISCANGLQMAGIVPSATELLDRQVIAVCEDFAPAGLPGDVEALLVVEFEGGADEIAGLSEATLSTATGYSPAEVQDILDAARIERIRQSCDTAFTALGRLGTVRCVDVAVPPARLSEAMSHIGDIAGRYGLRGAHMCRAAEGIVRSVFLYDAAAPGDLDRIAAAMADVARMTAELGGDVAGEHGIGVGKRDVLGFQLTPAELALQMRLKSAFDAEWLLNNGKVYPLSEESAPGSGSG